MGEGRDGGEKGGIGFADAVGITIETKLHMRSTWIFAVGIASCFIAAPEIPTISESGVSGFELGSWYGLLAPANTPREIVTRLHAEVIKALAAPEVRDRIKSFGTEPLGNAPEEFAAQIRSDIVKWAKVARAANVRAD